MGVQILSDVLDHWNRFELDDTIYVPQGEEPRLDLLVSVLPCTKERPRIFEGKEYFLGIEQVRDVIEGLEHQLERKAQPIERLKAVAYYAIHDDFIDPADL